MEFCAVTHGLCQYLWPPTVIITSISCSPDQGSTTCSSRKKRLQSTCTWQPDFCIQDGAGKQIVVFDDVDVTHWASSLLFPKAKLESLKTCECRTGRSFTWAYVAFVPKIAAIKTSHSFSHRPLKTGPCLVTSAASSFENQMVWYSNGEEMVNTWLVWVTCWRTKSWKICPHWTYQTHFTCLISP